MAHACVRCGKSEPQVTLHSCRVCFNYFCDDDAVQTGGLEFCSAGCGTFFFRGDGDEEED